jgi:hypothetical protein
MLGSDILRRYIRELIEESRASDAGDKLENADSSSKSEEQVRDGNEKDIDEMSVTADIASPMLPFGVKTPGKKKKPGWR